MNPLRVFKKIESMSKPDLLETFYRMAAQPDRGWKFKAVWDVFRRHCTPNEQIAVFDRACEIAGV